MVDLVRFAAPWTLLATVGMRATLTGVGRNDGARGLCAPEGFAERESLDAMEL